MSTQYSGIIHRDCPICGKIGGVVFTVNNYHDGGVSFGGCEVCNKKFQIVDNHGECELKEIRDNNKMPYQAMDIIIHYENGNIKKLFDVIDIRVMCSHLPTKYFLQIFTWDSDPSWHPVNKDELDHIEIKWGNKMTRVKVTCPQCSTEHDFEDHGKTDEYIWVCTSCGVCLKAVRQTIYDWKVNFHGEHETCSQCGKKTKVIEKKETKTIDICPECDNIGELVFCAKLISGDLVRCNKCGHHFRLYIGEQGEYIYTHTELEPDDEKGKYKIKEYFKENSMEFKGGFDVVNIDPVCIKELSIEIDNTPDLRHVVRIVDYNGSTVYKVFLGNEGLKQALRFHGNISTDILGAVISKEIEETKEK